MRETCYAIRLLFVLTAPLLISAAAHGFEPVRDVPFPQKVTEKYDVTGAADAEDKEFIVCGDALYLAADGAMYAFDGDEWKPSASAGGAASAGDSAALHYFTCRDGEPVAARFENQLPAGVKITQVAAAGDGVAWLATGSGVMRYSNGKYEPFPPGDPAKGPLSAVVRDIFIADDGAVYFATDKGVSVYREGEGWSGIRGPQGLPYEDTTSVSARAGALLVGTTIGAARRRDGRWQYYQSGRYLPDDYVLDVELDSEGSAWFATKTGVSRVEFRMITLKDKSDIFLSTLHERYDRLGFIGDAPLRVPGDISTVYVKTHDNENVWTGMYIAAECYRYAVTGEEEAIEAARRSLDAMLRLETITGVPGLFARSFREAGGELWQKDDEWHETAGGKWLWRGDTSSDEVVGRFYGLSIFYDLCANDGEKELIRGTVSRTMRYIIDNDYYLIDVDGEKTKWGMWNPDYLSGEGRFQRNLNALEILSFLKTAYYMTGDSRFQDEYVKLIKKHNYGSYAVKAKLYQPMMINHSDDLLAFLSYYPLLKYEDSEFVRKKFLLKSIRRTWKYVRPTKNPNWGFIYGAALPDDEAFDPAEGVWTLRRIPLDPIYWEVKNSHRVDIEFDPHEGNRPGEKQSLRVLPPDERFMLKFNENPFRLDGYWKGQNSEPPTFWLLPYWMGRYYGFITPPQD